jgi:type VI secretion system protein ImpF
MSELVSGASVPLFDKLVSENELHGERYLTPEQLEQSIAKELLGLFNSRARLEPSRFLESTGTVIDYGIPDISSLSPKRGEDLELLEQGIKQAVVYFEPRLNNVSVKATVNPRVMDSALIQIQGTIPVGLKVRQLSFDLSLSGRHDAQLG